MPLRFAALSALAGLMLAAAPARAQDVQLDVNQTVLQNFISTVGTVGISGGASASVPIPYPGICWWGPIPHPCIKWTSCTASYHYSVSASNIHVQVQPSGIPFSGNASTQASAGLCGVSASASYAPLFNGSMSASWNNGAQQLWFGIQTLNIEIYVRLLGYKISFGFVNVGGVLPNPLYKMSVPLANTFVLPAPISKSITVTLQNPTVTLLTGDVRLTTNLHFASP